MSSVGCSSHTNFKQKEFKKYLSLHIKIVENIMAKKNKRWPYNYFDLTAGSGYYIPDGEGNGIPIRPQDIDKEEDCIKGSPIIVNELIKQFHLNLNAYFFEENEQSMKNLKKHCDERNINAELIQNSWEEKLESKLQKDYYTFGQVPRFGLIYSDPNGIPNFEKLGEISRLDSARYLDFMIHISSGNLKRVRRVHEKYNQLKRYIQQEVAKENWIIKPFEDNKANQWCFLIGGNDSLGKWRSEGFYSLNDSDGKEILDYFNYTKDEKKNRSNKRLF